MSIDWEESASKEQIIDKLKRRIVELEEEILDQKNYIRHLRECWADDILKHNKLAAGD